MAGDIDLEPGNVSHGRMDLFKADMFLAKLKLAVSAALFVSLQAAAQQPGREEQPARELDSSRQRDRAGVQVWVGVDVLPGGIEGQADGVNSAASSLQYSRFAGTWTVESLPGLVLTLQMNGDFALTAAADLGRRCSAGVERGTWSIATDTSELLFHIQTDTNGRCGLSSLDATMAIVTTESGLTLIIVDPAAAPQEIPMVRTEP